MNKCLIKMCKVAVKAKGLEPSTISTPKTGLKMTVNGVWVSKQEILSGNRR